MQKFAYNVDNSGKNIGDLGSGKESTPFIHGAGHVDPNRALNLGLVYDLDSSDYLAFLCSIGYDSRQIIVFTREPASLDICAEKLARTGNLASPGDLNYPSFAVEFSDDKEFVKYKRVVTNVGSSVDAVYNVKVDAPAAVEVNVSPNKLVFSDENRTHAYEITFAKGVGYAKSTSFRSIEWSDGSHSVRSPIAVRWTGGFSLSM